MTFTALIWVLDAAAFGNPRSPLRRLSLFTLLGWAFGFGYFLAGIHWVGYSFLSNPSAYPVLTAIGMVASVLALTAGLGFFYGLAGAICAGLWRPGYPRLAAFAFAFFLAEFARSTILTGFPWNLFGVALTSDNLSMQAASVIGVAGLTLAALLVFPIPASFIATVPAQPTKGIAPLFQAAAILIAIYGFGYLRLSAANPANTGLRVRIVQPNVAQRDKYVAINQGPILDKLLSLSKSGTSGEDISAFDYVVWPESSLPFLFVVNEQISSTSVKDALASLIPAETRLIIGAERATGTRKDNGAVKLEQVFNSLFVIASGGVIEDVYDKVHLVPFGEFLPLGSVLAAINVHALSHNLESFTPGTAMGRTMNRSRSAPFAPLICYEVIFPGSVSGAALRPSWVVNVTNDAWFGSSTGPYQHFHLARIRAVEEGIPLIRAANTGISAVLNAYGQVVTSLGLGSAGTVDSNLPASLSATIYSRHRMEFTILLILLPLQIYLSSIMRNLRY